MWNNFYKNAVNWHYKPELEAAQSGPFQAKGCEYKILFSVSDTEGAARGTGNIIFIMNLEASLPVAEPHSGSRP